MPWTKLVGNVEDDFIKEMFLAKSDLSDVDLYSYIQEDLSSKTSTIAGFKTALAQLEIIGVKSILENRMEELKSALNQLKQERQADSIFLTGIDILEGRTYFFFTDAFMREILHRTYPLKKGPCYDYIDEVITRKDISSHFFLPR